MCLLFFRSPCQRLLHMIFTHLFTPILTHPTKSMISQSDDCLLMIVFIILVSMWVQYSLCSHCSSFLHLFFYRCPISSYHILLSHASLLSPCLISSLSFSSKPIIYHAISRSRHFLSISLKPTRHFVSSIAISTRTHSIIS